MNVFRQKTRDRHASSRRDPRAIALVAVVLLAATLLFMSCVHQPITVSYTLEGETEFGIAFVGLTNDATRAVVHATFPSSGWG